MSIKDWHEDERPREKLLLKGASSLSDSEILAIFLRTGTKEQSAIELARTLIDKFGSLVGLLSAPKDEVLSLHGIGTAKYAQILATLELGKRYLASQVKQPNTLKDSQLVKDYITTQLRHLPREVFAVLFLTNDLTLIQFEILFTGGISSCSVCVREVLKSALKYGTSQLIIAHNHPTTSAIPSDADLQITDSLNKACQLIDMKLIDHIIVSQSETLSFREQGLMN